MVKLGEILTLNNNKNYLINEDNLIQVTDEELIEQLENIFANMF